jgi:hypothetical protein
MRAFFHRGRSPPHLEAPIVVVDVAEHDIERLQAEARYASERLRLYRAKAYGGRPTTPGRWRELERAAADTQARLDRARAAPRPGS